MLVAGGEAAEMAAGCGAAAAEAVGRGGRKRSCRWKREGCKKAAEKSTQRSAKGPTGSKTCGETGKRALRLVAGLRRAGLGPAEVAGRGGGVRLPRPAGWRTETNFIDAFGLLSTRR